MADPGAGFLARLGAWAGRRAEPRLWISLAGAGCALAIVGVVMISGDAQVGDEGFGDGSRLPGILLCLAVAAGGYVLLRLFDESPAASAGVTAIALAVPPLFYFLTFDDDGLPPWSAEGILTLSALVWLVSYIVGPARGRPLLLGAGLVAVALLAIQLTEEPFSAGFDQETFAEDAPFSADEPFPSDDPFAGDESLDGEPDEPNPTTIGIILLLFGAAYLAAAWLLDRRGFAGTATPFVVAALAALPSGIAFLGDGIEAAGAGVASVIAGLVVAWFGARSGRRASTVIGAGGVALGAVLVIGDAMQDASPTSIGVALLLVGAALAVGAQLLHMQTGESPQVTPGPSVFGGPGTTPRWPGPSPYAPPGSGPSGPSGPPVPPVRGPDRPALPAPPPPPSPPS